jgi:hypothetical protein
MSILKHQSERNVVHIKCKEIYKQDADATIVNHIRKMYGNVCGQNGFSLRDSIQMIERSMGKLVTIDSQSCVEYNVAYEMDTIYPSPEDKYDCIVESQTKMGLIGYLDYSVSDDPPSLQNSPILFIIPVDFGGADKSPGDKIKVEVLDSRVKFQARQIQCVAKMI